MDNDEEQNHRNDNYGDLESHNQNYYESTPGEEAEGEYEYEGDSEQDNQNLSSTEDFSPDKAGLGEMNEEESEFFNKLKEMHIESRKRNTQMIDDHLMEFEEVIEDSNEDNSSSEHIRYNDESQQMVLEVFRNKLRESYPEIGNMSPEELQMLMQNFRDSYDSNENEYSYGEGEEGTYMT